jgi:hypothetical protein
LSNFGQCQPQEAGQLSPAFMLIEFLTIFVSLKQSIMRKLFLLPILLLVFSCSSSDSGSGDSTISNISDIAGLWKLSGTYANASSTNIATECELQFGSVNFGSVATEKKGALSGTCSEQTFTYSDYNVVDGQLRMTRNNIEYRYYVKKNGNTLSLTRYYSKSDGSDPIIVSTAEQKTNKYLLQ